MKITKPKHVKANAFKLICSDVEETPEEKVEEQCVEVDAADDRPGKLGELAPQLVVVGVPRKDPLNNFACLLERGGGG